jgi:hypothetical protein
MKKPIKAREYNLPTKIKRDKLFVKPLKFVKEYSPLMVILQLYWAVYGRLSHLQVCL